MLCNKRLIKIRSWFLAAILSISTITGPLSAVASAATAISYYSGTVANDGEGNFISSQNRTTTTASNTLKTLANATKGQTNQGVTDVTNFQTAGYVFTGWLINGTLYDPQASVKKVKSGENLTAIAQWAEKANITINGNPVTSETTPITNGTVSLSSFPAAQGQDLTLTLSPSRGNTLKELAINDGDVLDNAKEVAFSDKLTYTIPGASVSNNINISVSFAKAYTISSLIILDGLTPHGSITPSPLNSKAVAEGNSYTVTITPDKDYQIDTLYDGSTDITADVIDNKYTLENISADHRFTISFKTLLEHNVTVKTFGGVTATPTGSFTVSDGETKTIKFNLADKYRLSSIKVNGEEIDTTRFELAKFANQFTVRSIKEDTTITITAEEDKYNIRTNVTPELLTGEPRGTITESGSVFSGEDFEITVTPDEHYILNKLVICDSPLDCIIPEDVTKDVVNGKYTIKNITKDTYATATFTKNNEEYAYNVETTEGVKVITPLKTNKRVGYGDTEIVTFSLDEGYEISSIKINGEELGILELEAVKAAGELIGIAGVLTVTPIEGDTTVEIAAKIKTYNLAATSTNLLRGIVSPVLKLNLKYGETYTLNITPYSGYELDKLTFNGKDITSKVTDNVYTTVLNKKSDIQEDGVFLASFKKKVYTITVDAPENITVDPADTTISVEYLDTKTLTIAPKDAYHDIESISINGEKLNAIELALVKSTGKLILPLIGEDKNIVITEKESAYDVKTSVAGEGGTITESKIIKRGDNFLIKVTPDDYYEVDTFTVDGKPANLVAGYYLLRNVTENHEVVVSFKLVSHNVHAYGSQGTIVTPNFAKVQHGDDVDLVVKAIRNYEIQNIYINGKRYTGTLEDDTLHLENISRNTNIVVSAKKVAHDIVTRVFGGHGTISDSENIADGESFTITATPDEGYKVKAIYVNGRKVKFEDNSYTIKSVKRDTFVVATFTEYLPAINLITNEGVEIDGEVPTEVTYGSDLELNIAVKPNYYLDSIKVNGVEVELPLGKGTLTISNITEDTTIEILAKAILAPDTGKGTLVGENATPHMLATIIVAAMASVAALLKKRSNR